MFFLFLFSFVISSPTPQSIVVCFAKCPDSTSGHLIIATQTSQDVSKDIDQYLSGIKNDIYFYNESDFTFVIDLQIFEGHTVEFQRLDDAKPASVELDCTNANGVSSGSFSFKNIYIDLFSSFQLDQIQFDSLTLVKTTIDLYNIKGKLLVGSLTSDDSFQVFSTVTINISYTSKPGVTLNVDSSSSLSMSMIDYGAEMTFKNNLFSFLFETTLAEKRFSIINNDLSACSCEIKYKCSHIEALIEVSLTDLANLYFLNDWPSSAIVQVISDHIPALSISANSTVLPISLSGITFSTIIITQESTTITGDISSPIVFVNPDGSEIRKKISIAGSFSGKLLDLGSSYYDITLSNLDVDISSFGIFPFAFRVGPGGASTLKVLQTISTTTKMTSIYVYPDFTKYLSDDELQKLLKQNWTILELSDVSFSYSYVSVMMQSDPFIHGFIDGDSCISVRIESSKMILSASPPSLLPLNICFDGNKEGGECSPTDGIEIDSIYSITKYFEDGMKYLNLSIKAIYIENLDLTEINSDAYEGAKIILKGGSSTQINTIATTESTGITYLEINNIILGKNKFWVKEITFCECKTEGNPTFEFKQCELVTGDDSFIQNISPHIISTIPKITYRMDKYDAFTISDKQYIFYDIAVNDFSEPAYLSRSAVTFLDILYDVGMTETAEDNDLNITMETDNPPSFNVTFLPIYSPGIWDNPELILYKWSRIESSSFKTYFIHNDLRVKIVLTEPYKPTQIIPIGSGIVTYETRYNSSIIICTALDSGQCPEGSTPVSFDKINEELSKCSDNNIALYIQSQSDKFPSIDIYNINKKTLHLIGWQSSSNSPANIVEITSSKEVDITLTTIIFENIIVKATSQTTKMTFGEVRINNAIFDSSFKNVEVTIDDFYCEYKDLSYFKKVTITDNLIVDGELATDESTVEFIPDKNANDLNATISSDVTLLMGDKSIKIGKTSFLFGSMESVYDIVLYFESNVKEVQVNKQSGVSEAKIPNVQIKKVSSASFVFSNDWNPSTERTQPHIFLFSEFKFTNFKVYLTGPNTPISFSGDGDINFVSRSETVGISGYFDFHELSSSIILNYEKVTKTTVSVDQYINTASNLNINFQQPNIEFDITQVNGNLRERSRIQPVLYSSLEGDSLLVIKNPMNNAYISNNYHVQVPITESIANQAVIDYIKKTHTLIKISNSDTGSAYVDQFQLILVPTTHGFTESNMNMNINEENGYISLVFKKDPLQIPFVFCYEFGPYASTCEFTLDEQNISNFADVLPPGALNIQAKFGNSNENHYFNLNIPKIKGSSVSIIQQNKDQLPIKISLGNGIISMLQLSQVFLEIEDESFKVGRVELKDEADINKLSGFEIINIDYDTVWNHIEFKPCSNIIILNLTASSLTFTENGWEIDNNDKYPILSSNYPNMKFQLLSDRQTILEAAKNIVQIQETTIYSLTKKFVLGSNWQQVTSLSTKVNFIFDNDDISGISVMANSYPFIPMPRLMSAQTVQLNPSILPYTVSNSLTFKNLRASIDFSNVADDSNKAHINFASVTFQGLSSLSATTPQNIGFSNDASNNAISIDRLEIVDDSVISLSNAFINNYFAINGESSIYGDFYLSSNLDIQMKWKLNKMPKILIQTIPDNIRSITLSFDENSIDGKEDEYENYLYNHTFELVRIHKLTRCESWKVVMVFDSPNVPVFGEKSIFNINCTNDSLLLYGARHIKESSSKKKLSAGAIVGIVFSVIIVIAACVFGVYIYLRRRHSAYQQLNTDVIESKDLNQDQYTN